MFNVVYFQTWPNILLGQAEHEYGERCEGDVEEGEVHAVVQRLRGEAAEEGEEELRREAGNVLVEEILKNVKKVKYGFRAMVVALLAEWSHQSETPTPEN